MVKIVSIHSYRGGTGKSNVSANLAWLLAREGKRVAVLDTDLQSPGVHMVFEFDTGRITYTLSDFLFGKCDAEETAYDISRSLGIGDGQGRLWLVPASMTVEAISRILAEGYDVAKLHDQFNVLAETLELDYLLVDTHPGLNRETMMSIAVSDALVLLLRPDTQDFHGTAVVLEVARRLGVPRTWVVANKVASQLSRTDMHERIRDAFGYEMIGLLPLSDEVASLGSRGLFASRFPDHPIAVELRSVANRMLTDLSS